MLGPLDNAPFVPEICSNSAQDREVCEFALCVATIDCSISIDEQVSIDQLR